jgi:predicted AAA+ superfamily ATPase
LRLFREKLLAEGVNQNQIISINFEDPDVGIFRTFDDAWKFIRSKMDDSLDKIYIFLDEVQQVPEFERLVDGLFVKSNTDVYVTGSNAKFLSGELATFLTGRYVEISMQPLSFAEYQAAFQQLPKSEAFAQYMQFGGFPFVATLGANEAARIDYLSAIFDTIIYKDALARLGLRDGALLKRIVRFIFDNIGNPLSVNRITGTFKAEGITIAGKTIDAYINALCETLLVYHATRYDIKGRNYLKTLGKYYIADQGLRAIVTGQRGGDMGHILENIVFLELKRRYRDVHVGTIDGKEVDFVAFENATPRYFQVALSVRDESTLKRELAPFKTIRDQYPKTLITLDYDPPFDHNGIRQVNAVEFLLEP